MGWNVRVGLLGVLVLLGWVLWPLPEATHPSRSRDLAAAEPSSLAVLQESPRGESLRDPKALVERQAPGGAPQPIERLDETTRSETPDGTEYLAAVRASEEVSDATLGRLQVEVYGPTGKPFPQWFRAEAVGEDWVRQAPAPKYGKTVLGNLPWNETFTVRVTPPSGWNVEVRPAPILVPTAAEQAPATLSLTLQPPRPRLRGAIVDAFGQRLTEESMELRLPGGQQLGLATDARGTFDLWIPEGRGGTVSFRSVGESSRAPGVAERNMPTLALGEEHDFGVIAMQKDALLLSGRFVLSDGSPIVLQSYEVLQEVSPDRWRLLVEGHTDEDGWTEVPWQATNKRLDLRLRPSEEVEALRFQKLATRLGLTRISEPEGYFLERPQPVLPGRTDATWVWKRGATVVGSVVYEPGRRPLLTLVCRPEHGRVRRYDGWRPAWREGLRDPSFTFLGVPAGPMTLEVWSRDELLHRFSDVMVPSSGRLTEPFQNLRIPALPPESTDRPRTLAR